MGRKVNKVNKSDKVMPSYMWPEIADIVSKQMQNTPRCLQKADKVALENIYSVAKSALVAHYIEEGRDKLRNFDIKLYRKLSNLVGKMITVTDVELYKEVGKKMYSSCRNYFYCQKIIVDPEFSKIVFRGYEVYENPDGKLEMFDDDGGYTVMLTDLKAKRIVVKEDRKHADYAVRCAKTDPPTGLFPRVFFPRTMFSID